MVRADLLFLQEVQGEHSSKAKTIQAWPQESQFEYLADQIWPHYAYGKNAAYEEGHHGNAILSRYPIVGWENINISTNLFEMRGILHVTIEIPEHSKYLHCFCLHLGLFRRSRNFQLQELCERVEAIVGEDEPLIIAGDFNDWSGKASPVLESRTRVREVFRQLHGAYATTFPSRFPVLKLDRIYVRGLSILEAQSLSGGEWNGLSDHCALFAELKI